MATVQEEGQGPGDDEEMESDDDEESDTEEPSDEDSKGLGIEEEASNDRIKVENKPRTGSRSPSSRRSKAPSPTDSLVEHTASLHIETPIPASDVNEGDIKSDSSDDDDEVQPETVKTRVASDIQKNQARQARFHSKRSTRKIGRPKGSKAKQDTRVKLDKTGFWD